MRFGWKGVALLAVVALAVFLLAPKPPRVTVASVTEGEAAEVVYATGVVEPTYWAAVAPLVRARIVETCGCEGESVEAGRMLFRLDASEVEAQLAEAEARLDLATRELARASDLLDRRVGTQQSYDAAAAKVSELEASVVVRRRQLADYVASAPLAGTVLRLDGEVGEVVEPSRALAWVGQARPIRVIAEVNEEDIPRVAVGQRALLQADAFPGRPLEAAVESITPKGDPVLKTYRVRLGLPDDAPLFIGMTVDVNIVVQVAEAARIAPAAAVADGAVWVVDEDDRARRVAVTLGLGGAERVQLVEGPDIGARIVSPAVEGLVDGAAVRVIER